MIKKSFLLLIITAFIAAVFIISCNEKEPVEPNPVRRKSPIAIAAINHDSTYIKIVYGQPYKRDRKIFGSLVPYGDIWRTGANEATELTTTGDLLVNGERLNAGTYALFTIPGREEWTIILNDSLGQWGAFTYDSTHDILRTTVPSVSIDQPTEAFTIKFGEVKNNSTTISLSWDTTKAVIPITILDEGSQ